MTLTTPFTPTADSLRCALALLSQPVFMNDSEAPSAARIMRSDAAAVRTELRQALVNLGVDPDADAATLGAQAEEGVADNPNDYIRVTDDDGTIYVEDKDGGIKTFAYANRYEQGGARKAAEKLASSIAIKRSVDWGCNY